MTKCQLCLREFKKLRFNNQRVHVCTRCVNFINKNGEVAKLAEDRLGELLRRGMMRRVYESYGFDRMGDDFERRYRKALPGWINRLLANPDNKSKDVKIMRAYRRGLIHYDMPAKPGYPLNWDEVATRIRFLDELKCSDCGRADV